MIGLIMLAAGSSQRFGTDAGLKQFADIRGKPVLVRALMPYLEQRLADAIVVVVPGEHHDRSQAFLDGHRIGHQVLLTDGGATRQLSIRAGLAALDGWAGARRFDTLILHNAASPNTDATTIQRCLAGLADAQIVQACQPELRTQFLARDGFATQMLPRDQIVCSADPTVFRAAALRDVLRYQQERQITADTTTDVALALGLSVGLVVSTPGNIKITGPFDLAAVSAAIAQAEQSP